MISQERFIQTLRQTFTGENSEHVRQAEDELTAQYEYEEFPSLICEMIETSFSSDSALCKASVFQLKRYLLANPQFLIDQGINLLTHLTLVLPPDLHPILEVIADTICQSDDEDDASLVQAFPTLFNSESPISGFILLNSYLNCSESKYQEFSEDIDNIINTEFQIVQQILEDSPNDPKIFLYIHYFSTSCVSYIIKFTLDPEQINSFYSFSIQIIESLFDSPIFDISSDFFEVILNCTILFNEESSEELKQKYNLDPISFLNCAGSYFQHSPSFLGLTQIFQIMKNFLKTEKIFSEIQDNLPEIVESFFYPVFQISEEDQLSFETDPAQFLESVFPSIMEEETPRSSAASCLYQSSQNNQEVIPSVAFNFIIKAINNNPNINSWELFSTILFFSSCSQYYIEGNEDFNLFIDQVISPNLQLEDDILISSSLIFLSNFPISFSSMLTCNHPLILSCINSLAENESQPIICYLCCCATGHLLSLIKTQKSSDNPLSLDVPPEVLSKSMQNLFIFSQEFPTERIAQAFSSFIEFFTSSDDQMLDQFAEQTVTTLMELLIQYMQEDSAEAHKSVFLFSNAIHSICTNINISDQSLFDYILEQIDTMIEEQLSLNYFEDILPLIDGCVKGVDNSITDQITSIPQKLQLLMEGDGGTTEALQISEIYKTFTLKFIDKEGVEISSLINPIIEIVPLLMEEVALPEMVLGDEIIGISNFTQLLFIFISNFIQENQIEYDIDFNQCIAEWIQPLATIDSKFAADSLCAMIQFSPSDAFDDAELPVFDNWIANSRPKAFLASAMSVLNNFELLQNIISEEQKQQILEKSHELLSKENQNEEEQLDEIDQVNENDEFFNMESIKSFFDQALSQ